MKSKPTIIRECDKWPELWMGVDKDVPYGQGIVKIMIPFIESLVAEKVSDRVLNKHLNNLWLLGGEIIRNVSLCEEYNKISPAQKLLDSIGSNEGPLCRHLYTEAAQRSFDSTCGKLYNFLIKNKKPVATSKVKRT